MKILIILIILAGLLPMGFNFEKNGVFAQTAPVLQNDKLPEFIEWAKTYDIKLIGTRRSGQYIENNIWNLATDEIPLTTIDGINSVFEDLKKIPPHLINTLRGNAIFFSSGSDDIESSLGLYQQRCVNRAGFFLYQTEFSQKYQKKPAELPLEAHEGSRRTYISTGILPYMGEDGSYVYPYDMFLCMPGGATVHEFGHIVDLNGIRMFNGRETALGKSDEETRQLYAEYERIFGVNKLSPEIRRQWRNSTSTMPGILNNYGLNGDDENFAVSFDFYVGDPQFFREKAAKDSGIAEKYEFLKNKIFLGKEYSEEKPTVKSQSEKETVSEEKAVLLKKQIADLQDEIVKLQLQLKEIQKTESKITPTPVIQTNIFSKTLQRGAKNDEVYQLQKFLKQYPDIYPEGLVTGYFGPLTEAAVKRFQEKHSIESVGIVGPKTGAKLNELFIAFTPQALTPPAGWPDWLKKKWENNIEEARKTAKEIGTWDFDNEDLPQLLQWTDEHKIEIVSINDQGAALSRGSLVATPATNQLFKGLKALPPHLIKFLENETIKLKNGDCWATGFSSVASDQAVKEKGIKKVDFLLCRGFGAVVFVHELGHIVDFIGIRNEKSNEFSFGKTDEGIRALREEYDSIFLSEEYERKYQEQSLTAPPPGFISTYAARSELENFADHFMNYIFGAQYFRERAAKEPLLAKKYNFLKTKIFLGLEYGVAATTPIIVPIPTPTPTSASATPKPTTVTPIPATVPTTKPIPAPAKCADGTPYNQCSLTKPKFCNNGVLEDSCLSCGCATDYECELNKSCRQFIEWPEWLNQEKQAAIEDVRVMEEWVKKFGSGNETLYNDKLPLLLEWAKIYDIKLIGYRNTYNYLLNNIYNPAIDRVSLTAVPAINYAYDQLQKLPPHLANLLRGNAIIFTIKPGGYCQAISVWHNAELSYQYQKKPYELYSEPALLGERPYTPPNIFPERPNGGYTDSRDIFLAPSLNAGLMLHEFGHIVDEHGIRMEKGREYTFGKTDEEISGLYDEYKRIFSILTRDSNILEDFAGYFNDYVNRPAEFREKAGTDPAIVQKYEFLKTKIFLGREY